MDYLRKYEWHFDIITKIFMIIILLFICYRIVIYDQRIDELAEIIGATNQASIGMPVYMGQGIPLRHEVQIFTLYITGAVVSPGVYDIEEGSRIADLIVLAGGALENADLEILNLAARVEDARHVRIPFIGEDQPIESISVFAGNDVTAADASNSVYTGLININTSSLAGLITLPGIGEVTANNIINHRNTHGSFSSLEELMNVTRIGQATFDNIRHLIVY
ncbi:MAG: ComEA family DNA-binding protein [Defluviitaleaceae bacterium]|nr:ComEA family DNA-binding protein [Defluviitaleaceae bacterium]